MPHSSTSRLPLFLVLLATFAIPARANTTLMILVDWWLFQPMDTVVDLRVFQPTSEIKMADGSAVPNPVVTNALTRERFSCWYALPNFNADDYDQGRIRIFTTYLLGWYQNDSTYRAFAGDTIFLPDTQKTFTYQMAASGRTSVVVLPSEIPKFFVFDSAGSYRGPKLYRTQAGSRTDVLNMRTQGPDGRSVSGTGRVDKCLDSLKSDTVWIRWGTPSSPPGPRLRADSMRCFRRNPFLTPTTSTLAHPRKRRPPTGMELSTGRDLLVLPGGMWDISGRKRLP